MIRAARWLIRFEIGIWRSLFLWATRRVAGMRPGAEAFAYHRQIAPIIGAFIFVSAIELPVVHLLIPWDTVRLVALFLSVWGLLWMIGLLASMKVFPHLLEADGLRVRFGAHVSVLVPWEAVESVAARRRSVESGRSLQVEDGVATVPVMKQTRVDVALREPVRVGEDEVREVRLYVDAPKTFVPAARERLAERVPR
jgi:hypothetical protein